MGVIFWHLKASTTQRVGSNCNSISSPPVIDLESFAYKPLKDPVLLKSRRAKVSYLLPLLLSLAVLLVITFPRI
jgi:hypothetical protein